LLILKNHISHLISPSPSPHFDSQIAHGPVLD